MGNFFPPEWNENQQNDGQDRHALDHLFSVTYEELRRLAATVRRSDPGATLSPTTMVNETWLKLSKLPRLAAPRHYTSNELRHAP